MGVEVLAPSYDFAAEALIAVNHDAAGLFIDLTAALAGCGSMAGDDSTSTEFAASYDESAQATVDAVRDLVDAAGNLGVLTAMSIENHRTGDAAAVYTAPPLVFDGCLIPAGTGEVDVEAFAVPASEGGDAGELPEFLDVIIDHVQGVAWPNADTGKLRDAAAAWRTAGGALDLLDAGCQSAIDHLSAQRSPEIPLALQAVRDLETSASDLADACRSLASACEEYAQEVEDRRDEIKEILRSLAIEAGVTIGVGVVLSFVTVGLTGAAATAAVAARAATYGARILGVLQKLKNAVRMGAVVKLGSAGTKVKGVAPVLRRLRNRTRRGGGGQGRRQGPKSPPRPIPSLDDLSTLRGSTPDEVRRLIPDDWTVLPLKRGEGTRYLNPHRRGESIMLEAGTPGARDPLHGGPYVKISRNGEIVRIPLEGNPVLEP